MMDIAEIDTSAAKLPSTYSAAKRAISQCASIDECKDWSDKAAALASYARQAKDDQLEKMAHRIRLRATRRAGELLKQIEPASKYNAQKREDGTVPPLSRKAAALDAGLSERQAKTAQRLANVPEPDFERMVEANATVTEVADVGTQKKEPNRAAANALVYSIKSYVARLGSLDLDDAIQSLSEPQKMELRLLIGRLDPIHDRIATAI